jgi:serine/threonine protein kinase
MLLKGRYEVLSQLSRKSRLAKDRRSGAHVVVRELAVRGMTGWADWRRAEEEAASLANIQHPGVPRVLESFTLDAESAAPVLFVVQEYLSGVPLSAREARPTQDEVLSLARELFLLLGELHRLSPPLLHGALRPERVLRRAEGSLALVGFGAASLPGDNPGYEAPERSLGPATISSELYSAGAVLYQVASGRAFGGEVGNEIAESRTRALLQALLQSDPGARPSSAEAALSMIHDHSRALAVLRPAELAPLQPPPPRQRVLTMAGVSLVLGISLLAGIPMALGVPLAVVVLFLGFAPRRGPS